MTTVRIAVILLALFGIAAGERAGIAQTYTSKPVKLIVPYAPGGPNDIIARILAQKLAEGLGGNFFVENTAGAGGTIATGQVASAAPDGTTILVANQDLIVQPIIKAKVPYDPFRSFTPVSLVVSAPEMIVVHPSVQVKDLKELIALLKANPASIATPVPATVRRRILRVSGYSTLRTELTSRTSRSRARHLRCSRCLPGRRRCSTSSCRRWRHISAPAQCARSRSLQASARRNSLKCRPSPKRAIPATRSDSGWACLCRQVRRKIWSTS